MKKLILLIFLITTFPVIMLAQTYTNVTRNTYYTKYFKVSSTLFKVGNFSVTESFLNATAAKVTFPGFGTSHSLAAYGDHTHTGVYEPSLGNPALSGYILSSTSDGTRSWIEGGGGGGGTMIYPAAGITISTGSAWGTSVTDNSTNWNTAYTDRLKWDGGSTGLVASTGRLSLGGSTVGINLFTLTNPGSLSYLRINADNTVTSQSITDIKTSLAINNVTNESKSTMFTTPTFTGTVTIPAGFLLGATTTTVTGTELNYVHGVTSNIQTQLNDTTSVLTTNIPLIFSAVGDTSMYPIPGKIGNIYINTGTGKIYISKSAARNSWISVN